MNTIVFILLMVVWWTTGYYGFRYWWLKDQDFTKSDRRMCCLIAIVGPITFLIGWAIHEDNEVIASRKK